MCPLTYYREGSLTNASSFFSFLLFSHKCVLLQMCSLTKRPLCSPSYYTEGSRTNVFSYKLQMCSLLIKVFSYLLDSLNLDDFLADFFNLDNLLHDLRHDLGLVHNALHGLLHNLSVCLCARACAWICQCVCVCEHARAGIPAPCQLCAYMQRSHTCMLVAHDAWMYVYMYLHACTCGGWSWNITRWCIHSFFVLFCVEMLLMHEDGWALKLTQAQTFSTIFSTMISTGSERADSTPSDPIYNDTRAITNTAKALYRASTTS